MEHEQDNNHFFIKGIQRKEIHTLEEMMGSSKKRYKREFGKFGYLVNGIKYCNTLNEAAWFAFVSWRVLAARLDEDDECNIGDFTFKVIPKRRFVKHKKRFKKEDALKTTVLSSTEGNVSWRR